MMMKLGRLKKYNGRELCFPKFNFLCLLLGKLDKGDVRGGVKPAKGHILRKEVKCFFHVLYVLCHIL